MTCVELSPTRPVVIVVASLLPLRTTVTEPPVIAWLGTTMPLACAVTIDADALMPERTVGEDWSSVIVTG